MCKNINRINMNGKLTGEIMFPFNRNALKRNKACNLSKKKHFFCIDKI